MKRRVDDLSGRGEAVSGIVSAGGVASGIPQGGQGAPGGPGGASGAQGGYVRGPTVTQLGPRPGQPSTPVASAAAAAAVAVAAAGTPVPGVVPVPATTAAQGGTPTSIEHQSHNPTHQPGENSESLLELHYTQSCVASLLRAVINIDVVAAIGVKWRYGFNVTKHR